MKVLSPFLLLVLFRFGHSLSLRYGCVWRTFSASIVNTGGVNESPGMVNVMERTTDGVNNHNNSSSSAETADEHLGNLDSPVDDADDKYLTELMKLGWSPKECASALATAQGDISKAVEILQDQDEYRDHLDQLSSNITISFGWNIEAALIALEECNGNVEDALARLQKEEDDIKHYFESNVADMVGIVMANIIQINCKTTYSVGRKWLGRSNCKASISGAMGFGSAKSERSEYLNSKRCS